MNVRIVLALSALKLEGNAIMQMRPIAKGLAFGILAGAMCNGMVAKAADRRRGEQAPWSGQIPGVEYRVIVAGVPDGARPTRTSAVRVRYEGRFDDGTPFDASPEDGRIVPLKAMIPGFQAALMQMRIGDVWEIRIPSELAYGPAAPSPMGGKILEFRITLLGIGELPAQGPPFLPEMPH